MQKMPKVLVLCRNRLLGQSILRLLRNKADLEVLSAAPLSSTLDREPQFAGADVVVLDSLQIALEYPGFGPFRNPEAPSVNCLLVGMANDTEQFLTAVRHGVLGYTLGEASAAEVVTAIRAVTQGEAICPPLLLRVLFDYLAAHSAKVPNDPARLHEKLSRREKQLLPLIGRGLTNKEIANQLNLSEQTVKNHVHRILCKTGVEDRLSAFESCRSQLSGQ